MPPMARLMRNLLTGSALFLAGCLALAGPAGAEAEPPISMAVDPTPMEPVGVVQVAWPVAPEAGWAETFGQPAEGADAQIISLALVTEPTLAVARPAPAPAYRVQLNEHVRFFLDRFQTGYRREVTEGRLARSGRYLPMILDIFREKGLPEELVFTAMIESGFNPVAVSRAGAKGLWQFMAPTARRYGLRVDRWVDERLDPEKSTVAAANYLRDLHALFGSWDLAKAAYNAGEMKVSRAIQGMGTTDFWALTRSRLLRQETKDFVPAIHAATLIGREPERYGFVVAPDDPLRYEIVTVSRATPLNRIAVQAAVSAEDLERLNPELRLKQTPPGSYALKVPTGGADRIQAALDRPAARQLASAPS